MAEPKPGAGWTAAPTGEWPPGRAFAATLDDGSTSIRRREPAPGRPAPPHRHRSVEMTMSGPTETSAKMPFQQAIQRFAPRLGILDSPRPNKYGPAGFAGAGRGFATTRGCRGMGDDTRKRAETERPLDDAALSVRLRRLGDRLERERASSESGFSSGAPPSADGSAMARGLRLSSELVAGVLVGAGLGWVIDRWLGISPWGLIVFLLLGFAAGVVNVIRAAGLASGPGDRGI